MNMLRHLAIALLLLQGATAFAQGHTNPDYVRGYNEWSATRWNPASTLLEQYWKTVPFGRTYDVSYWLGTSWCRQSGMETLGTDLLDWSYHFQSMPEKARSEFRKERDLCIQWQSNQTNTRAKPTIVLAAAWSSATMRAEGKSFYLGNQDKGGLSAYPVRVKRKLPDAEFAGRLVDLGKEAEITRALQARAPGFQVRVGRQFALASAVHSQEQLRQITEQLDRFAAFLERAYALPAPRQYMTVYLFGDIPKLRQWADKLHGFDASPLTLGYSLQNDLSVLAMVPSTQVGTILHEVVHLMMRGGYGDAPQWLDEGMASLYETATFASDTYYGEPNWRSRVFDELSHLFGPEKLRETIVSPWFSDEPSIAAQPEERRLDPDEQAYLLAYSRMFVLYLQERGELSRVMYAFRNRERPTRYVPATDQAIQLLEKALRKPLPDVQRDFLAWTPQARNPEARLHRGEEILKPLPTAADLAPDSIDR
jgi:hypothetical protein